MKVLRHLYPSLQRRCVLSSVPAIHVVVVSLFLCFHSSVVAQSDTYIPKNNKESVRDAERIQNERKRISSSKIYSITTTKYRYKFGKPEKKGAVESVLRYNTNGDKIEEIQYNEIDGTVKTRTTYRYNAKGYIIEEALSRGENSFKTVHRYNPAGKRIETVYYDADGTVDKKLTFVYDDHNLLLETVGYLDDGRIYRRDSYFYDTGGNVTEFRNNLNRFLYRYDSNDNISSMEKYVRIFQVVDSVQYSLSDRYLFEHDNNDNLIEMIHEKPDGAVKSRFGYTVNPDGQVVEEKEFNGDGRIMYSRRTSYSKKGNIVEETGTDVGRKFRHAYRYDARGNKIEWISYDQINEPQTTTKYTYNRYSSVQKTQATVPSEATSSSELDEATVEEFFQLMGGRIVAPDGGYLGMINADTLDSQSIANAWGQYGYNESPTSIFNPSIPYGGTDGVFSPFNPNSPSPPSIYKEGKFFSYLTENENFRPRSSPKKLILFLRSIGQARNK